MPQTGTGWTQYHDFLMQQAIAMMAEPDWANNPALMAQLTPIQDELRAAGASLGENDQQIKDLFGEFQTAYESGVRQNETRYGQLLADANGNKPTVYNASTGQWEQNPNYQAPLSYNQRIDALTGAGGVYDQAQQRYDTTQSNQKTALDAATAGLGTRSTTLGNQAQGIANTTRSDLAGVTTGLGNRATTLGNTANANSTATQNAYNSAASNYDTRANTVGGQAASAVGGFNAAYTDPNGILSGYNNRATTLSGQVGGVQGDLRTGLDTATTSFGNRASSVGGQVADSISGYTNSYNDPNGINAGYSNRASQLGGQISGVQGSLGSAMGDITSRYGSRESDLKGLLQGYGDIQRDDLNRSYDALSQQQRAELQNRGLGNSTVMSSVQGGVENQRQLDRSRLEDQLRREQLGYQSQWSQDTLTARDREAQLNAQYGMQGVGMNAQYGADSLNARQGQASETLGARFNQATMNAGLLGDVANAQTNSANTNAQYGMQGIGMNAQYGADALGAREGYAGNALNAGFDQANLNAGLLGDSANAYMQTAGANDAARNNALNTQIGLTGDQYNAQMSAANANTAASQNALNTQVGLTGDYWGAAQQAAQADANLGLQGANWAGQVANVRNQLTGEPLRAIEARTDITPSLSDVANMAMQVGTSQSTQFALPGMSPTSYYQQQTQGA